MPVVEEQLARDRHVGLAVHPVTALARLLVGIVQQRVAQEWAELGAQRAKGWVRRKVGLVPRELDAWTQPFVRTMSPSWRPSTAFGILTVVYRLSRALTPGTSARPISL